LHACPPDRTKPDDKELLVADLPDLGDEEGVDVDVERVADL